MTQQIATLPQTNAREFALRVIADVVHRRVALDGALEKLSENIDFRALSPSDRGLARAIATSAVRGLGIVRKALADRLQQGMPPNAPGFESIMISGVAQILFLNVGDHAAVDTSVSRMRADRRLDRYAPLANAVLRSIARDSVNILASVDPLQTNTPAWLAERWSAAYGTDTARLIARAHLAEPPLDLTVKSDAEGWAARLGGSVLPTGTVRLARAGQVIDLDGFRDGEWWVQDIAAALPARLLNAQSGERVLDLCAAPGGKTAQLALSGATVVAVDRSAHRMRRLEQNLARLSLAAEVHVADAAQFTAPAFDRILLDAPCSATGTIRRHPDVAWTKKLADVAALADLQSRLLDHAWTLLRPGGTLLYATCSLEQDEGERQIETFLSRTPTARIVPVAAHEIGGLAEFLTPQGFLRTLPSHLSGKGGCDGFFACRLGKT